MSYYWRGCAPFYFLHGIKTICKKTHFQLPPPQIHTFQSILYLVRDVPSKQNLVKMKTMALFKTGAKTAPAKKSAPARKSSGTSKTGGWLGTNSQNLNLDKW